jgi:predicted DNA-binding protein (MmcQ/YjbR family)
MTLDALITLAGSYRGVTEDIKWDHHLCFSVGAKMFLLTSPDDIPVSACFKVDEDDFETLSGRTGFRQAPHFAKRKWIWMADINLLNTKEWSYYLKKSYGHVAAGLTKKLQRELGLL